MQSIGNHGTANAAEDNDAINMIDEMHLKLFILRLALQLFCN